jgi:membrane associated rhomboid family serine protease
VTTALLSALYAIVLTTAFAASRVRPLATPPRSRWPWATTVAVIIVGIPTLAQFAVAPWILNSLERNWTLIARGQVWRLLTSLVVQDGGVAGAIFNLVALAIVGFAAEQVWGPWRWTVIALSGALAGELWGKIVQPVGAGNSVAVFSLAASLCRSSHSSWRGLAAASWGHQPRGGSAAFDHRGHSRWGSNCRCRSRRGTGALYPFPSEFL